jgi:DNA-binding response OmpR family regulator
VEAVVAQIAVIEDDPVQAKLFETILSNRGHKVIHATDGKSGLRMVQKEKPDLVILDLSLPLMDGFEVCKRLKEDEATKAIPILMTTAAYPDAERAKQGLDLGAEEFMVKPVANQVLIHNVERLVDPLPEATDT